MFRLSLAFILSLVTLPALAAEDPDIRNLMTPEEFAASGLGRLSDEEFEVINRWLIRYTAQDAEEVSRNSPAVQEIDNAAIVSRIEGNFDGWNGPTRFPLENGQLWETNSTRRYSYPGSDPRVEITRNWMGVYRMRLLDTGKSISVRRLR